MGLLSNVAAAKGNHSGSYIEAGQHILIVQSAGRGRPRQGSELFAMQFKVESSFGVREDGTEYVVHQPGSLVKIVNTDKHEIDIFLNNTKDACRAAMGSFGAASPDEIAYVSAEDVDAETLLEICYGPFERDAEGKVVVDTDPKATLGHPLRDSNGNVIGKEGLDDADARVVFGGIPVTMDGVEPGTFLQGARVKCETYRPPGKRYTVNRFSALPMNPDA